MFALFVTVILGVGSLTIDLGYARTVQQQLQYVADAAALGAARSLDGTAAGIANARGQARRVASANVVAGQALVLDANSGNTPDGDVVIGAWVEGVFTPTTDSAVANAVHVRARAIGISTFFAGVAFGTDSLTAGARSTARAVSAPAGGVSCFLPVAVPLCELQNMGKTGQTSVDNVAWVRPRSSPNLGWLGRQLAACTADGPTTVADTAYLQDGVETALATHLTSAISTSRTRWHASWGKLPPQQIDSAISASHYGKTLEGPMIIFDGGPSLCAPSGGNYTRDYPTVGYVWGAIYDLKAAGPTASRKLYVQADTTTLRALGTQAGGVTAGITVTASAVLVE